MTSYASLLISLTLMLSNVAIAAELTAVERLGKSIFFDATLSNPVGQSCASCHSPDTGFADPRNEHPVSAGIIKGRFTKRSAPSIAYAGYSPNFHFDKEEEMYIGGYFADGRAARMEDQAAGPFLSSVEMNNKNKERLIQKVAKAAYRKQFEKLYGENIFQNIEKSYIALSSALVAYQRSAEVNPFNSKYDAYLAGKAQLSMQEKRGLKLFEDKEKGNCAACHPSSQSEDGQSPLFTDFSYDNLGVAKNVNSPFYSQDKLFNPQGNQHIDLGLYETTRRDEDKGKFKVPTLRNIALTAPYGHNGVYDTLEDIINFYNTRDVKKWAMAEVSINVNTEELGDLKLTKQEVKDIEAFMKTLSDGYSG